MHERRSSKLERLLVTAAAVAATLVSLVPAGSAAVSERRVVVGIEFDPVCLNVLRSECNQFVSSLAVTPVLAGAFRVRPDFSFEPVLVERVDVQAQPFALTYHIRPEAAWSDGTPVSADDFIFTLETIRDPANETLRDGYQNVTEAVKVGPKTVTVRFSAPNPDWQELFQFVLPKHVLAGHDFDTVWRDEIAHPVTHTPIGSGPFLFAGRTPGQTITLVRNPRWWGARRPFLDTIRLAVQPSQPAQLEGIRNGTYDLIFPQAQLGIADLRSEPGIVVEYTEGTAMEHLDFNLGSASMPLLQERWFRQAVAHSIDREAIATAAYDTLVPSYPALHNLTLSSAEPAYQPVFARYDRDLAAVAGLMLGHGCVTGADGIWVCGGVRASVKHATTSGNVQRELAQQKMAEQARAAGIELVPDNSPASVLFGSRLGARDYESIMYAWVRLVGIPTVYSLYGCAGSQNFMGYCSPAVDALALAADGEIDPAERVRLANDANRLLAEDVPSLPLFMRIAFQVRRELLHGPQLNPGGFGTWNTEEWRLGSDVTPPVTTATTAPAANANGWNDETVTVSLAATDDDTGVEEIRYSLSGAQTGGGAVSGSTATIDVSVEGVTTLEYYGVDAAGNVEAAQTVTIRVDRTAPALTCSASPATLWPPTRRLEPVQVNVAATDAVSGVQAFALVSVAADPDDAAGWQLGTDDTSGSLRAELDRRTATRRYTLSYEAADRAGNTARCAAVVTVARTG